VLTTIALGGGAGNTQYDSARDILCHRGIGQNELAESIQTKTSNRFVTSTRLQWKHGLNIDSGASVGIRGLRGECKIGGL